MKLELISFKICPFAQRAVITMLHKGVSMEISYINPGSPPEWFRSLSPFGKVPILCVDNRKQVIFESAVICEFLDEYAPGSLLPGDALHRALDRSWIEFGTTALSDFSSLIHSTEEARYQRHLDALRSKLHWLEGILGDGPWFNGKDLSLVDIAYAPLFMRTEMFNLGASLYPASDCPRIHSWSQQLLGLKAVRESVVDDFSELLRSHIIDKAPYAATALGLSPNPESQD